MLAVRCWRSVLLALALSSPCMAAPGAFTWETDLEAAKQVAARTNRLVLVHFGAPWCQPCQQLERDVFSQPGFGNDLKATFVGVKLNYDSFPATARQYGVQSIPSDVIITPQGQLIERVQSPLTGPEYSASLARVAASARGGQPAPPAAANVAAAAPGAPPPGNPSSGGRYSEYFGRPGAPPMDAATNPYANTAQQPPAGAAPQEFAAGPQLTAQAGAQSAIAPSAPPPVGSVQPAAQLGAARQLPPGNAPLGLDGFCPVSLSEKHVWVTGDLRFGMQHHGRTYLFAGPDEQAKFLANPDRFSPVMSGDDPVLALDQGQHVAGSRMYGVSYADHVYLFTSEQTLQVFQQNPKRYAAEAVQARH